MNLDVLGHVVEAVRSGRARIDRNPYPHLYVEDVLPPDLYDAIDRGVAKVHSIVKGDTVREVLGYVQYEGRELVDVTVSGVRVVPRDDGQRQRLELDWTATLSANNCAEIS